MTTLFKIVLVYADSIDTEGETNKSHPWQILRLTKAHPPLILSKA
jgi:hypothetical protein